MLRKSQHGFCKGKLCLTNLLEFSIGANRHIGKGHPINTVLEFKKCVLTVSLTKICQRNCTVVVGGRNGSHMDKELGMEGRHMLSIFIMEGDGDLCSVICCCSTLRNDWENRVTSKWQLVGKSKLFRVVKNCRRIL